MQAKINCPVPSRLTTGADILGFQKRFSDLRREHLLPGAPAARFDHFYCLAINTRVAPTETGKLLRLGDSVILQGHGTPVPIFAEHLACVAKVFSWREHVAAQQLFAAAAAHFLRPVDPALLAEAEKVARILVRREAQ